MSVHPMHHEPARFPAAIEPSAAIVTVTPTMALAWLDNKGENRPIYQQRVEVYKQAMLAGEWRLTGEAIKLDRTGCVRDGQHRLWACVEANVPFTTFAIINVPDDAFDVMDSGLVRSNKDIVALHHYENYGALAACARYSLIWEAHGNFMSPSGRSAVGAASKPKILRWIEQNADAQRWCTIAGRTQRAFSGGPGVWSAILYRLSRVSQRDAEVFVERLVSGADMPQGDPILALRNRLSQNLARHQRLDPTELAAVVIKTWNMYRRDEQTAVIYWRRGGTSREPFPEPV